jgi:photosystem II stability/assembly factor-like uncharacterized protein
MHQKMQKGINMRKFNLFSLLVIMLFASYSFAQWATVPGFGVTGAGTYPSISVAGPNLFFISGGNNTAGTPILFKSTNGGTTFATLPVSGITYDLMCVWGVDANTIFVGNGGGVGGAGTSAATIYKTTNGGTNWTAVVTTSGAGFFNGVVFSRTSPLSGFTMSDPTSAGGTYFTSRTTDGGTTWTTQNPAGVSGCMGAANSTFILDNNFYGFGSSSSTVFTASARMCIFTSNGGTNWNFPQLPGTTSSTTQSFIPAISFNSNKIYGLAGSSPMSNTISRTTDGGATWNSLSIPSTLTSANCWIKYVPYTNIAYMVTSTAAAVQSYKTTNNGTSWTTLTWPANVFNVAHMDLYPAMTTGGITAYLYAVCGDGTVVKMTDVITSVNTSTTSVPTNYKLEQNYPNPFNPVTKINYSVPKASFVTLKIYNVLGNEVMTVVDEQQTANNYTYDVDFSKLSSGVYYYTLKAGEFTATKKLTLVK